MKVSLDRLYKVEDTRLVTLNNLLTQSKPPATHIPTMCKLLSTAKTYLQKQRRSSMYTQLSSSQPSLQPQQPKPRRQNTSNLKSKFQDMSQIRSTMEDPLNDNNLILYQNYTQQANVIMQYLLTKDNHNQFHTSEHQKQILSNWILCLNREDRKEVEKERTWFPNPRNIQLRHISAGLNQIYGVGVKRRLRPGEQASLIQSIQRFLNECSKNINQIALRESKIHEIILNWAELQDLVNYPFCMKQFQLHFKLMATRWRYSGKLNLKKKVVERAIYTAHTRGHFLDLTKKDNDLVKYLLKHSKQTVSSQTNSRRTTQLISHIRKRTQTVDKNHTTNTDQFR